MISINLYEIIMQMVNFLILLYLLNKFLVKPLSEFIQKRAEGIETDIEVAKENRKQTDELFENQQVLLVNARQEAKEIRKQSEEITLREKENILKEAKNTASDLVENAKKEIDLSVKKAKKDLQEEVGELAVNLAEKILKKSIDSKQRKLLLDDGLNKFTTS